MKNISIIGVKDFKGFLFTPTFYVVAFLCAVIMSWMYPNHLSQFIANGQNQMFQMQAGMPQQMMNIHYAVFVRHLSLLNLILIFLVPALTMRMIAEEKKLRTYDLLLTSPVTSVQIVVGKYLAVIGAIFALMSVALLYPVFTRMFVEFQWGLLFVALLGIFLLAAVYAAMDLFCSALTESALVAYVMAVIMNISVWFVGVGAEVADGSLSRQIFEHISLNTHLSALIEGAIRTNGLIFLASVIVLFVFLTERVVESSRWR